jgi:hypothetical protein
MRWCDVQRLTKGTMSPHRSPDKAARLVFFATSSRRSAKKLALRLEWKRSWESEPIVQYRVKIRAFSRVLRAPKSEMEQKKGGPGNRSAAGNKFPKADSGVIYDQRRRKRYTRQKWAPAIGFRGGNNWPIENGRIFEALRRIASRMRLDGRELILNWNAPWETLVPIPSVRAQHKISIGFYPRNDRRATGARNKRDFRVN